MFVEYIDIINRYSRSFKNFVGKHDVWLPLPGEHQLSKEPVYLFMISSVYSMFLLKPEPLCKLFVGFGSVDIFCFFLYATNALQLLYFLLLCLFFFFTLSGTSSRSNLLSL